MNVARSKAADSVVPPGGARAGAAAGAGVHAGRINCFWKLPSLMLPIAVSGSTDFPLGPVLVPSLSVFLWRSMQCAAQSSGSSASQLDSGGGVRLSGLHRVGCPEGSRADRGRAWQLPSPDRRLPPLNAQLLGACRPVGEREGRHLAFRCQLGHRCLQLAAHHLVAARTAVRHLHIISTAIAGIGT